MDMNYNDLILMVSNYIDEFKKQYLIELEKDNIDEDSGVHTVFSLVFNPVLFNAIRFNDEALINKMFTFMEAMETSGDIYVSEVLEFTILEELADEFYESEISKYMGPETKMAYEQISKYIKK
ncbi:hypothetical protein [uncultured Fenollaria sp.]|uniref:DUF7674 family protein n=1 Tax=uncultured Fenollaria sp. TaxID=1686315 RepID=UPI0025FF968E|nr:hypothetical protein [uncultured Fenollaria sp.]